MLVYRVYWLLLAAFAAIVGVRLAAGDVGRQVLGVETIYSYEQAFDLNAAPGAFHLDAYVPRTGGRITVLDENIEAGSFAMDLEMDEHGRRMVIRGEGLDDPGAIRYHARIRSEGRRWVVDVGLGWDELGPAKGPDLAATEVIQTGQRRIVQTLASLLRVDPPAKEDDPAAWRAHLRAQGIAPAEVLRRVYDRCHEGLAPAGYSGTTDALTALSLGEASCGGKSRLMAALTRTAGIPTRLVGGVILGDGRRKRTSHVWVECRLAGEWVAFDPLNGYFAEVPAHYLLLYRDDEPLISHTRGLAFDYSFLSNREEVPRLWVEEAELRAAGQERSIPLLRRQQFTLILLAPFALLLTVFLRQVVGLRSMGVFLPVLLGFSLTQTGWLVGGLQLALAIFIGVGLRSLLGTLQLLHLPRNAVMISFVVVLFLGFSLVLESLGLVKGVGTVILPLAATAMTIERYTLTAMDKGHGEALSFLLQTFFLAACCWVVLSSAFFKVLTVAHPEIFLLVVAQILVVGNYRGLRLLERWRFRHVRQEAS